MRYKLHCICAAVIAGASTMSGCQRQPHAEATGKKELAPSEVVKAWNDALTNGDVKTAAKLTSRTSGEYIRQEVGSLEQLSKMYRGLQQINVETKTIHEEISGDTAVVIYRIQYGSDATKYWMDKLLREDGSWKVAPQYVQNITLMEKKP